MYFSAAGMAVQHGYNVTCHDMLIVSKTDEEAIGLAYKETLKKYPVCEGWSQHTISVHNVTEFIKQHEELAKKEQFFDKTLVIEYGVCEQ